MMDEERATAVAELVKRLLLQGWAMAAVELRPGGEALRCVAGRPGPRGASIVVSFELGTGVLASMSPDELAGFLERTTGEASRQTAVRRVAAPRMN